MLLRSGLPCPDCGSSDALAEYTNGTYCFSCKKSTGERNEREPEMPVSTDFHSVVQGLTSHALLDRGIDQVTAEHFGVLTEFDLSSGVPVKYYFPYYKDQELVGYKVRLVQEKSFYSIGNIQGADFFGQHLAGENGRMIVVTEGEMDAMAATQMLKDCGKNYRVVSLPRGANAESVRQNLEWIESFNTVILNFDQDKPGQDALNKVLDLFTPGKAKIMTLPTKDANDLLLGDYPKSAYLQAINNSKQYQPDGIVAGANTWELYLHRPEIQSIPYPDGWDHLNQMTYGVRLGELDTWTSGSGMGKTQVMRELQYHFIKTVNDNVGIIALEEPLIDSVEALMAIDMNRRIHLPDVTATEEELHGAWENTSGTGKLFFYDHFGSMDDDSLVAKIRYFAKGLGCKYIFLDHLSIVVSEFASEGGERERIDTIMTRLKNLTQELGIWIGLVVHLRKTGGGQSFEEGGVPTLDDLRGSGSIKQLSNSVYALSRNQQAEDFTERNTSQLHVLKCRFSGRTGHGDLLYFDDQTGRMVPVTEAEQIKEEEF